MNDHTYDTPQLTDFGAVNEVTQSSTGGRTDASVNASEAPVLGTGLPDIAEER